MSTKIINVEESIVNDIQTKDIAVQSMQDVLTNLLESHALDEKVSILESPLVNAYQVKIIEAKKAFEQAKDALVDKYIEPELQKKVTNWSLNYSKCELELTIKD